MPVVDYMEMKSWYSYCYTYLESFCTLFNISCGISSVKNYVSFLEVFFIHFHYLLFFSVPLLCKDQFNLKFSNFFNLPKNVDCMYYAQYQFIIDIELKQGEKWDKKLQFKRM